ncbi:MAG: hypothetical protein U9O59_06545 [Actinomycetota bacterium]|nr:hypothetical protein [Actinomycetota bacterium]
MIKTGNNIAGRKEIQRLKEYMPEDYNDIALEKSSVVISLAVMIILNVVEIGYFIYSNYFFNDIVVTLGSAILIGYTLYSMVKFLPKVKKFIRKPIEYLKEMSQGFEYVLNFMMVPLEAAFCIYIMFKIFINYILVG